MGTPHPPKVADQPLTSPWRGCLSISVYGHREVVGCFSARAGFRYFCIISPSTRLTIAGVAERRSSIAVAVAFFGKDEEVANLDFESLCELDECV